MFHAFGNNPITYTDPDGREDVPEYDIRDPTPEQLKKFNNTRSGAKNNLTLLLESLKDPSFKVQGTRIIESAKNWLGVNLSNDESLNWLTGKIENIINGIDEIEGFKMDFGTKHAGSYGYVKNVYDKIIYGGGLFASLKDDFVDELYYTNNTTQGFIVHEMSHRYADTTDVELPDGLFAYGLIKSYNLPDNQKTLNADNWEYFYEYLYTDGAPRWDE